MSERRKKIAAFLLKIGGRSYRAELFDADQWKDGEPGCVRLRVNGRWHNRPDGARCWLDAGDVARVIHGMLAGEDGLPPRREVPERPTVRKGQRVSMPCGPYTSRGEALGRAVGFLASDEVMLGSDCRWYVIAFCASRRMGFVPYDELAFLP